jgi:hypothetical protein
MEFHAKQSDSNYHKEWNDNPHFKNEQLSIVSCETVSLKTVCCGILAEPHWRPMLEMHGDTENNLSYRDIVGLEEGMTEWIREISSGNSFGLKSSRCIGVRMEEGNQSVPCSNSNSDNLFAVSASESVLSNNMVNQSSPDFDILELMTKEVILEMNRGFSDDTSFDIFSYQNFSNLPIPSPKFDQVNPPVQPNSSLKSPSSGRESSTIETKKTYMQESPRLPNLLEDPKLQPEQVATSPSLAPRLGDLHPLAHCVPVIDFLLFHGGSWNRAARGLLILVCLRQTLWHGLYTLIGGFVLRHTAPFAAAADVEITRSPDGSWVENFIFNPRSWFFDLCRSLLGKHLNARGRSPSQYKVLHKVADLVNKVLHSFYKVVKLERSKPPDPALKTQLDSIISAFEKISSDAKKSRPPKQVPVPDIAEEGPNIGKRPPPLQQPATKQDGKTNKYVQVCLKVVRPVAFLDPLFAEELAKELAPQFREPACIETPGNFLKIHFCLVAPKILRYLCNKENIQKIIDDMHGKTFSKSKKLLDAIFLSFECHQYIPLKSYSFSFYENFQCYECLIEVLEKELQREKKKKRYYKSDSGRYCLL